MGISQALSCLSPPTCHSPGILDSSGHILHSMFCVGWGPSPFLKPCLAYHRQLDTVQAFLMQAGTFFIQCSVWAGATHTICGHRGAADTGFFSVLQPNPSGSGGAHVRSTRLGGANARSRWSERVATAPGGPGNLRAPGGGSYRFFPGFGADTAGL